MHVSITNYDAYNLDVKLDDGRPVTGIFKVINPIFFPTYSSIIGPDLLGTGTPCINANNTYYLASWANDTIAACLPGLRWQ
jgi:hypothetical protein